MYTHEINDEDVSIDLLVLADQYDIETLRKIGKVITSFDVFDKNWYFYRIFQWNTFLIQNI